MNHNWKVWDNQTNYGDILYKRATGELPEMESSKALTQVLEKYYASGLSIADVGCGAGHYLKGIRERIDANVNYTGIDATAYYLEQAKLAFPDNAKFMQGDIFDLPGSTGQFDITMCNNVLIHLPPPPLKPISELMRISKKHTIIRTALADRNYIVKELRQLSEVDTQAKDSRQLDVVASEEKIKHFNYFNMYTKEYITEVIHSIDPTVNVEIIRDQMWEEFDNTKVMTKTATKSFHGFQKSGNLLLDFHFIIISKQ